MNNIPRFYSEEVDIDSILLDEGETISQVSISEANEIIPGIFQLYEEVAQEVLKVLPLDNDFAQLPSIVFCNDDELKTLVESATANSTRSANDSRGFAHYNPFRNAIFISTHTLINTFQKPDGENSIRLALAEEIIHALTTRVKGSRPKTGLITLPSKIDNSAIFPQGLYKLSIDVKKMDFAQIEKDSWKENSEELHRTENFSRMLAVLTSSSLPIITISLLRAADKMEEYMRIFTEIQGFNEVFTKLDDKGISLSQRLADVLRKGESTFLDEFIITPARKYKNHPTMSKFLKIMLKHAHKEDLLILSFPQPKEK